MATANGVDELARAKWKSSGLTDEQAARLCLKVLSPRETLGRGFTETPALLIPYFTLQGTQSEFYRVRYLAPPPGFAGMLEKPQRYVQPKGTLNEVYLPPLLERTWEDISQDTDVGILITEGEFKAASACAHGLPCIGLGGVDVWRSTKRGIELLPVLEEIRWQNRKVAVVFDSDAAVNPNVVRAQRQLSRILTQRGAFPSIVSLPSGPNGEKQGLDDFLMSRGLDAFREVLAQSPGFPEAQALWGMNEEVVYVRDPGIVVVRETNQKLTPQQFVAHAYANRHYTETFIDAKGDIKTKQKPLAPRWVSWERRFEVSQLTYAPGAGQIVDGRWNVWPGWGVQPQKGDVGPMLWLLEFLFKKEMKSLEWFLKWLAAPLQYPGLKQYCAAVLWGLAKGTGKTLVAYTMMRIYGRNSVEIKNKDLRGGFNSWAENRQFVYGDEITGGDRRVDADYMKGLITQEHVRINAKYLPEYTLPDCINYLFTSNHPDAIFLEDHERRYFIHEVQGRPAERSKYERVDRWLRQDNGAAAWFDYLLKLDLQGFNPKEHAMETDAARAMALLGKSDIGNWCSNLREDPTQTLKSVFGDTVAENCCLFTAAQLLRAYDPERRGRVTVPGMARELRRAGFIQVNHHMPLKTCMGLQRLWAVRELESWVLANQHACRLHFNKFFSEDKKKYE